MQRIVLTGATGHVGRATYEKLIALGYDVTALVRKQEQIGQFKQAILVDITKDLSAAKEVLSNCNVLVHLAAHVPKAGSDDDKRAAIENITSSLKLVDYLKQGAQVVFASTCETYGLPLFSPITQEHPLQPLSFYGASKAACEQFLRVTCQKKNVVLTILRFASVYGPGERIKRALPNFITKACAGKDIEIYGDGSDIRDYVFLSDAVQAIVCALEKRYNGVCTIASGEKTTIKELAEQIVTISESKSKIIFKERQKQKIDYVFSVDKAKQELGFRAQVSLKEGLYKQIIWYKNHSSLI